MKIMTEDEFKLVEAQVLSISEIAIAIPPANLETFVSNLDLRFKDFKPEELDRLRRVVQAVKNLVDVSWQVKAEAENTAPGGSPS